MVFMTKSALPLEECVKDSPYLFSLVFGNESSGLLDEFSLIGKPIRIPQSPTIDSLNLGVAVGIAAYSFAFYHELIELIKRKKGLLLALNYLHDYFKFALTCFIT